MLRERYRHSASAANLFLVSPSKFIWRHGLSRFEPSNARMNMGNAAEFATYTALVQELSDEDATNLAVQNFDKLQEGELAEERDKVGPITCQFLEVLRPHGKPASYQDKRIIPGETFGLRYDVTVVTDFTYEPTSGQNRPPVIVDTKATLRCPSSPHSRDLRQQALYSTALGRNTELLYATPKKHFVHEVTTNEVAFHLKEVMTAFRQIENLDEMFSDPKEAARIIPLDCDFYGWSGAEDLDEAREYWRSAA